ncbi:MAG: primosomal protein N' [Clostridia bacterium]|nr:primosomal protein N' [Clostridia bacterium]
MRRVASVAISDMISRNDKLFDYVIPDSLAELISVGSFVLIGFGKSNRRTKGIVLAISEENGERSLKPINAVLDNAVTLNEEFVKLIGYIKKRCFCSYYDAAKLVIPYGCNYNLSETVKACPRENARAELSPLEEEIYCYIASKEKALPIKDIYDSFGDSARMVLSTLKSKGCLELDVSAKRNIKDLTVNILSLSVSDSELARLLKLKSTGEKQAAAMSFLRENGEMSAKELCYMTGASAQTVNSLIKKGIVSVRTEDVYRLPKIEASQQDREIILNGEQSRVFDEIVSQEGFCPFVLRGVTGSGKTHVYLKLCKKALDENKTAIVLMPEIALTSQIITRFYKLFGRNIAIIHSGLSVGEKTDEWRRLKNGEAKIAIGTRSAIFAPVENVGVIVIDEEQEHTYKSEMTPKYSARDIALLRAKYNKCPVVFSSATPSVATYSRAKSGSYKLLTMEKRFNNEALPEVTVVDMRKEVQNGNTGIISDHLFNEISKNLQKNEQTLLFLNRRGYNWFISCRNCGQTVTCPKCSISLTYHSENGRLMCHHCGYSTDNTESCPSCGDKSLKFFGTGTQRVVSELEVLFPNARIMRLDADTTVKKNSHDEILSSFARHEADILVGTQMIAKGLDFPHVTLAAVLMADFAIYADDYKANEKTFAQVTQVIGRAGRAEKSGRAVVQTFAPENRVLNLAVAQDYEAFYGEEIELRKQLTYPPYCDICQLSFESDSELSAINAAKAIAGECVRLHNEKYPQMAMIGLGPSPARVLKINNSYKYKILLKCRINEEFYSFTNELLNFFYSSNEFKKVNISVEYNPENII